MKRKGTYPAWLSVAFKVGLGLLFFGFIYVELAQEDDLADRWIHLQARWTGEGLKYFVVALLLMPLNIGLEAQKWRRLMGPILAFKPFLGIRAICTGLTVSLFTPNRIGEFAGRILYLSGRFRVAGIFATFIGSLAQYVVYWLAALWAIYWGAADLPWLASIRPLLLLLGSLGVVMLLLFYFGSNRILYWMRKKQWKAPFMRFLVISGRYPSKVLLAVLLLASIRFTIFCLQLYALMLFVGFPMNHNLAISLLPLLFIAQTLVPSFVLTDLGIRGGLALFLFEPWAGSAMLALLPSYMLWLMNIIFPAFLGWLSLLQWRTTTPK